MMMPQKGFQMQMTIGGPNEKEEQQSYQNNNDNSNNSWSQNNGQQMASSNIEMELKVITNKSSLQCNCNMSY
jgi:hypothetical protein